MRNRHLAWLPILTLATAVALAADPPTSEREALLRVVTTWNGNCEGTNVASWNDMLQEWYLTVTDSRPAPKGHGASAWVKDGAYVNGAIADSSFIDPDLRSFGRDFLNDNLDEVDVAMIGLHGGDASLPGQNLRWVGSMRVDELGEGNCWAYQGEMQLGEQDLEFLHLSSCNSMDQEDWYPDWAPTFSGLHQVDAFHGVMWISNARGKHYRRFADDAYETAIGLAWVENLYDRRVTPSHAQCPVALAVGVGGNGAADCWNRLSKERYNHVFSRPSSPTFYCVAYVAGCDPMSEGPLPAGGKAGSWELPTGAPVDEGPVLDRTAMTADDYRALVEAALPVLDPAILTPPAGATWTSTLSVARVATAVGDATPALVVQDGPLVEARDAADTTVVKLDFNEGRIRYVNRARMFDVATHPQVAFDPAQSQAAVLAAFTALGLPPAEVDLTSCCEVDTVRGDAFDGASPSSSPASSLEVERLLTIPRVIGGLPVEGSFLRAAVSNLGEISRLQARWPEFVFPAGLSLRSRTEIVDEIAAAIDESEFGAAVEVDVHLAYVDAGSSFLPVAVTAFSDALTGQILLTPIAAVPADGDLDGVPDSGDLCPTLPDPDQADADGDGVGDPCDNCPSVSNRLQEDADGDGLGDVCEEGEGACVAGLVCDVLAESACRGGGGVFLGADTTCELYLFADGFEAGDAGAWSSATP